MRLLWIDGGMHAGVHREDPGAVPGEMDLRPVRGGGEGGDGAVRAADHRGGGAESAPEFLLEFPVGGAASRPDGALDRGDEADSETEIHFYAEQSDEERRRRDQSDGAPEIGELSSDDFAGGGESQCGNGTEL